MPNVKLFIDEAQGPAPREALRDLLPVLRDMLSSRLDVPLSACQLAVISVAGLADQPPVNAELILLPNSARTPERLRAAGTELRAMVAEATGLHTAVRFMSMDPATYIAMK